MTQFLRKIYLSFYWKGCVWEGVEDRTELQHIDPHSYGHNSVSFPFSWATQPGAWGGQPLWVLVFSTASYLKLIWSPTGLISNWLTPCLHPGYIIIWRPSFSWDNNSTRPRSRLKYPDIPRPDAPVVYTGAFPILTARPGRRSIFNTFAAARSNYAVVFRLGWVYLPVSLCYRRSRRR